MEKVTKLLQDTSNRYYKLPNKKWLFYQCWENTLLMHWAVAPDLLIKLLPNNIALDVYNHKAYMSIVLFDVTEFRSFFMNMKMPFVSDFKEINVRTYVTVNGVKGVCFFSLYADQFLAVIGASLFYQLPYKSASILRNDEISIVSGKGLRLQVDYEMGEVIKQPTTLDIWLTERHAFFQKKRQNIYRCDIHHPQWVLQKIKFRHQLLQLSSSANVLLPVLQEADITHFASKLDVLFWNRVKV